MSIERQIEKRLPASHPRQPLWKNRDYLLLWCGQAISASGTGVSQFALPLFILVVTHSPAYAGLIAALRALPYFVFTLPAGAFIDLWNRKRVMMLCDAGRAICLISIPIAMLFASLTLLQLALIALIEGTLYVFFDQADTASLPNVVSTEQLPTATGQYLAIDSLATLIGSSLGGLLYSIGQIFPFLFDACSYTLSVLSLFLMKTPFQKERERPATTSLRKEIGDGLRWLWHHPTLRTLAILTGGINFIFPTSTLLAMQIALQQHTSSIFIGLIFTLGGVGAICGALLSSVFSRRFALGLLIKEVSWGLALVWLVLALASPLVILAFSLCGLLLLRQMYAGIQYTYRLSQIPDHLLGRVNGVFRLIALSFTPVGLALGGLLLQWSGATSAILIFGACLLLMAVGITFSRSFAK